MCCDVCHVDALWGSVHLMGGSKSSVRAVVCAREAAPAVFWAAGRSVDVLDGGPECVMRSGGRGAATSPRRMWLT